MASFGKICFIGWELSRSTCPALIERLPDLPLLQMHGADKVSAQYRKPITGMTHRAQTRLGTYSWPGNIRELENVIGNACMMAHGAVVDIVVDINYLPKPVQSHAGDFVEQDGGFISVDELLK